MNQALNPMTNNPEIISGFAPIPIGQASRLNNSLNTFQDIDYRRDSNYKDQEKTSSAQETNTTSTAENNSTAASDERLKELFGSPDLVDAIADLNAYRYRYKDGAEKIDPDATPDKVHTGVMAQELQKNPATQSTVEEDPLSGYLKVNTKELSLVEMAILTEMAKKIQFLEQAVEKITSSK